jgi:cytoskeletal protein RodZ
MAYDNLSVNSHQIKRFKIIQNAKIIIVFVVVALFGAGTWFVYDYYQKELSELNGTSQDESISAIEPITGTIENDSNEVINLDSADSAQPVNPSESTSAPPANGGSPLATPPSSPAANSTVPSSASSNSIPAGVNVALNSIESTGIKGSPYVSSSLDTAQLPDGTSISFDRSSWVSLNSETGTIKAIARISGETLNTNITFAQSGGSWKAVGYSLN